MAEPGDTADEAFRLEAALERIARHRQPAPDTAGSPVHRAGVDRAGLARRLDSLIAELRAVLGRDSAD